MRMPGVVPVKSFEIAKNIAASSKDTQCFFRLLRAFLASQENTFLYIR